MIRFRRFNRRHLDFEFSAHNDFKIRIIERPGLWMSEKESKEMLVDLQSVVENCLGKAPLEYGILSGAKTRLDNAIVTILYERRTRRPIAFNAMSVMSIEVEDQPIDVIHLGLAMIDPGSRRQGLSWVLYGLTCTLLLLRNHCRPLWISNVTQIPSVVGHVTESLANVFPTPDPQNKRTSTHLAIAREIMRHHRSVFGVGEDAGFDEDRFVITNSYTGGSDNLKKTFVEATKHRDESFNLMCKEQLKYERGDDFLQIGQFNLRVAVGSLLRLVPRVSPPLAHAQPAFAFLRSIFSPALRWLTSSSQNGGLGRCKL